MLNRKRTGPLNTDLRPITYFYNLVVWGRFSGSSLAGLLGFLTGVPRVRLYLPLVIFLILVVGFPRRRHPPSSAFFTIGTTGFYGLSMEIVALFLFQNLYGCIYQKIGWIVALFMLGLALGGAMALSVLRTGRRQFPFYPVLSETAIICLSLAMPWIPVLSQTMDIPADRLLHGGMVMIGLTAGFQFPLVSALCMAGGMGQAETAAGIDSRDHLGACAGAFVTGVLLVLLLGIAGTCYLSGGIKGVSLLGLLWKK